MKVSDFVVEIRDGTLTHRAQLTGDDFAEVHVIPQVTDLGVWQVELPHLLRAPSGRLLRHPRATMLRTPGWGLICTGPGGVLLSGPVTDARLSVTPKNPLGTWTIQGVSDLQVVSEALAYGDPSTYNLTSQSTANDTKTAPAETLLHWYVNRNRGPGAVTQRKNPRLSMGSNLGRGATLTKSPRFQKLIPLLTEIVSEAYAADGTRLVYDVVQVGDELQFRTGVGVDRSGKIRLDVDTGKLRSIEYGYSAPTLAEAIVAGQGEGTARNLRRRTSSNDWRFHDEDLIERRDTNDNTELDQAGDDALNKAAESSTMFRAEFAESAGIVPGVQYGLGDLVSVTIPGPTSDIELTVPVSGMPVTISPSGVQAGVAVGSPLGTSWDDLIDSYVDALAARTSVLERAQ